MKRYLVTLATVIFVFGLSPLGAQDQAPAPYDQAPAPYGNQAGPPYNNQSAPSPYNNQTAPDPYNQGASNNAADQGSQGDQSTDGPGVGRVSYVQGDVSSQRGDNAEWVALTMNAPIAPGDRVAVGANSRAEVQLDSADVLRLSANTTANAVNLSRSAIQVQIGQGLADYSVLRGSEANTEIDTPNASIHPNGAGEFRIAIDSDSETKVTIRSGSADISTPQGSTHVEVGQMITIQGTDNPQYRTDAAPARDDFDTWNDDRNRRDVSAQSWHKTDPYYTGSEDLDQYGVWNEVPDYGQVWTPNTTDPNWAPYRDGRWVWEPYYGWTWVSSEPWGWAPYHYGRWFIYGGRWSWWPGPVATYPGYYPVWAPAYVSFFGFGGGLGVGFGFGFGTVGWFPIGPGDWFHPWWGGWGGGFHAYNNFGVHEGFGPLAGGRLGGNRFSNADGIMHDSRFQGGISSMSSHDFGRGAVPGNQQRFNGASLRQASMVSGKMPISPSRESFSPSGRTASAGSLRSAPSRSQHFFSSSSRGSTVSGGNRGFGGTNSANNSSANTGGSRPGSFERPSGSGTISNRSNTSTGVNRSAQGFGSANTNSQSGWQHFTPSSRGTESQGFNNRGTSLPGGNQRSYQGSYQPPSSASRGGASNSYSRSPLNMRQPIVTPRSGNSGSNPYGSSRYGSSGGFNSSRGGTNNAPRSTYSAPRSSGGSSSRGSGGGGSRGGSGGGHSGGGHHR